MTGVSREGEGVGWESEARDPRIKIVAAWRCVTSQVGLGLWLCKMTNSVDHFETGRRSARVSRLITKDIKGG